MSFLQKGVQLLPMNLFRRLLILLFIVLFVSILLRTAWLSDDAYITFRTVDNFVHGYGLTWNPAERVQAYTHPLWMFLLSAFYFFTREIYYTSLSFSMGVSLLAVFFFSLKIPRSTGATLFGSTALLFSRAFIDYSTSGLENPLTHLLLVLFFWIYLQNKSDLKTLFILSLLAALGAFNRLDVILIYLPPLVGVLLKNRHPKALAVMMLGLAPLILWIFFSLFYYGFPFPNTAYAKFNSGVPQSELTTQGFYYLEEPFSSDPTTFLILAPLLVLPVLILLEYKTTIGRQSLAFVRQHLPLILGITFYAAYLVRIGGDFMSGRMLTSLFLCTLILWTQVSLKPRLQGWVWGSLTLIAILSGLLSPFPTVFSDAHYREGTPFWKFIDTAGVADERGFYYQATSLLNTLESGKPPLWKNDWANEGRSWRYANQRLVVTTSIGFRGYYAGPNVHIVDTFALADPLLARLPILTGARWRIGHFERALPCGYLETLESGRNKIQNPNLALYYDKLSLVTRGPLFSLQRLREIWNLNTEKYSYLIQSYIPSPCREPSSLLHPP